MYIVHVCNDVCRFLYFISICLFSLSENGEYEFLDLKTKVSKYAPKGWKSDSNDVR